MDGMDGMDRILLSIPSIPSIHANFLPGTLPPFQALAGQDSPPEFYRLLDLHPPTRAKTP